jgi:hypothetical protein
VVEEEHLVLPVLLVRLVVGTLVRLGLQGSLAPCLRCLVRVERLLLIRLALVVVQEGYLVCVWVRLCVTDRLDLLVTLILNCLILLLDQMMMMIVL